MIVHIFNDQKKFSHGFFQMLSDHGFPLSDHVLHHYGKRDRFFDGLGVRAHFLPSWFLPQGHVRLLRAMRRADRIVVHSLAAPFLVLCLALSPGLGRKVTWVVWGKDLYIYAFSEHKSPPLRAYEYFRRKAIRNIARVVTGFEEDFEELRRLYRTRATNTSCTLLYPYNVHFTEAAAGAGRRAPYVVLLGNSASATNEHPEMLHRLASVEDQVSKIIVPLSYGGSRRYVHGVIRTGRCIFGERLVPVTDFMEASAYYELLGEVDIAVFNHKRQEAFNNICSLMLRGATVYLNTEISTARFLKRLGVVFEDCAAVPRDGLGVISEADQLSNRSILKDELDPSRSVATWRHILQA